MPELIRIHQADTEGWEWDVLVLAPGLGANHQYFPPDTLRQAAPKFDGARVFCLPDGQHSKTGDKSAQHIVGWLSQATYDAAAGIKARLTLMKTADWLRQNLVDSHAKGRPDLYGLSVDAPGRMEPRTWQGQAVQWITEFASPVTVDVVWNPGTPGGFQRALNAHLPHHKEDPMNREALIKILQATRPDLLEGKDPAAISMEDLTALLTTALAEPSGAAIQQAVDAAVKQAQESAAQQAAAQARVQNAGLSDADRAAIQQAQVVGWNGRIAPLIGESNLPQIMQANLRGRFMDALPADGADKGVAAVKQAIEDFRKMVDAMSNEGRVEGLGFARGLSLESEPERLQQAMDKMFGLDVKGDVPAFVSLRQAYVRITGDSEVSGLRGHEPAKLDKIAQAVRLMQSKEVDSLGYPLPGHVRISQAQPAAAWPLLLGNTMYRRLRLAYAEVEYYEDRIISTRRRATDYRTIEAMTPQYPADLPTISTPGGDYTEAAQLSEEGVSYTVAKRGRILTIYRETILNDDLGAVVRMVNNEGRAARRTFARAVWNLAINNATFDGDAVAVFHASHNNLGSTALTADATGVTALVARLNALMAQTEPGSGEKLGGAWWGARPQLAVPGALQAIAKQLNQSDGIPGTANNGDNPVRGLFGNADAPERILVNPLFTDATDWYLFRQSTDVEQIEVAFLMGQEQPEVFVADNQQVGQMFMADKLQYKIRHEYGADVVDYRGMDKSVVAG